MTAISSTLNRQPIVTKDSLTTAKVRTLIAEHLDVDLDSVTDEAHFADDLGADWLDCLELMIVIEDQFAGVEIRDDDVDQIIAVGDLIRYVENINHYAH